MKKLKEMLMESYAWEKKPGKPLATLAEVQAEYERKMAEQYGYGSRKPKFGKGSIYNDEPDFDKGVVGGSKDRVVNTKWDAIVDEYNSKPGFAVETGTNPRLYTAKITNTQTGDWWEAKFKNVVWTYTCEVGGKWSYLKSIDELIKKFNEVNGISEQDKPDFLDLDKDGNKEEPMRDAAKEMNEGGDTDNVLHLVSQAENMIQNLRKNMSTNSVLRLEEKMGYLKAYDELLDILSDIALEADRE